MDNAQVRARLLREPDLTLIGAVDICRANKVTQNHKKAFNEESDITVNKVAKAKLHRKPKAATNDNKDVIISTDTANAQPTVRRVSRVYAKITSLMYADLKSPKTITTNLTGE